jgi:hypothetical protein
MCSVVPSARIVYREGDGEIGVEVEVEIEIEMLRV